MNILTPDIINHMTNRARFFCEETKNVCPFWVNNQILEDLEWLDLRDSGNRAHTYWMQCHCPYVRYFPGDKKNCGIMEISCRRNDIKLGDYYGSDCKYCNPKAAELLKKDMENNK
jgi:hypothetical protein